MRCIFDGEGLYRRTYESVVDCCGCFLLAIDVREIASGLCNSLGPTDCERDKMHQAGDREPQEEHSSQHSSFTLLSSLKSAAQDT